MTKSLKKLDTQKLFLKALAAIEEQKLFFIQDVADWLGIAKQTLYHHFPVSGDQMDAIKDALNQNRIKIKVSIRAKLARGDKAAELLALYKLICTDEERQRLSMSEVNVNVNRNDLPEIDLGKLSIDERKQFYELYNKARITGENVIDIDSEDVTEQKKLK